MAERTQFDFGRERSRLQDGLQFQRYTQDMARPRRLKKVQEIA